MSNTFFHETIINEAIKSQLSAERIIGWTFNFNFLLTKAQKELSLAMRGDDLRFFFAHAMNLSVTIHSMCDFLWHKKGLPSANWKSQSKYVKSITKANRFIGVFIDLSNTYKHADRHTENEFLSRFEFRTFTDEEISKKDTISLRNAVQIEPYDLRFANEVKLQWPMLLLKDEHIYFCYAAEHAITWLGLYFLNEDPNLVLSDQSIKSK